MPSKPWTPSCYYTQSLMFQSSSVSSQGKRRRDTLFAKCDTTWIQWLGITGTNLVCLSQALMLKTQLLSTWYTDTMIHWGWSFWHWDILNCQLLKLLASIPCNGYPPFTSEPSLIPSLISFLFLSDTHALTPSHQFGPCWISDVWRIILHRNKH